MWLFDTVNYCSSYNNDSPLFNLISAYSLRLWVFHVISFVIVTHRGGSNTGIISLKWQVTPLLFYFRGTPLTKCDSISRSLLARPRSFPPPPPPTFFPWLFAQWGEERRGAARNSRKNRPLQHVMMEVAGGRAREQPFLRVSTVVAFISNGNEVVFLMSTIFVCIIVCFFYTLVKVEDKHWRVRGRPRLAGFQIQALWWRWRLRVARAEEWVSGAAEEEEEESVMRSLWD